ERHVLEGDLQAGKLHLKATSAHSEILRPQQTSSSPHHGFVLNQPDQALALAQREGKPLLIDFFGIWCPPCNRLDEEVFSNPSFQKEAHHFVLLKLDADSDLSWDLKSKYKVGGYPTLVFANPDGEELSRVVGFRPLPEILS